MIGSPARRTVGPIWSGCDGRKRSNTSRLPYYPHIDGLRGVAVLLVILFHYGLGAPGGYVGVDVFFVISGFLITSIVIRDRESGTFRLRDFWERRARRILPALVVVVAASVLAGWFLFPPADFRSLGESVLAQAAFLQNIVFWRGSGYFAIPSEAKPLLHTWSLAVEEQFYLGLPFILLLMQRWRIGILRCFFVTAAVVSFALGVAGLHYFPSAAFFFLPTRAWELLVGVLIALGPMGIGPKWVAEVGSALGLAAIVVAVTILRCGDSVSRVGGFASGGRHGSFDFLHAGAIDVVCPIASIQAAGLYRPDLLFALSLALATSGFLQNMAAGFEHLPGQIWALCPCLSSGDPFLAIC